MLKKQTPILLSLLFPLLTMLALLGGVRAPATVQAAPTAILTVNSLADDESDGCAVNNCTLREAITDTVSGGVIDFSVSGVINIGGNGQLTINKDLTISGTVPITVSGGNASRVFNITSGNVTFDSLTIADGNSQDINCFDTGSCGGGIYIASGTAVTLTHTTVISNSSDYGGGIFNDSGTLIINNSTISGNSATDNGGGIYNILAMLTLKNSTISGNSATYYGGGIFNDFSILTLKNSTISGNSAADNGGGIYNYIGTLTLSTSIIANSTNGGDCVNFAGTVTDNGFNLIEDGSNACGLTDGTNNNIIGQDPSLGLLQDNGGSTLTHALLSGSPAIDTGNPAYPAGGYDQRGVGYDRVNNGRIDIGAYESTCTTPIAVTSIDSSGAGTLRNAIIDVCNGGLITFDATLSNQTIDISAGSPITGQLTINKNVTISGTVPITVSGGNASRVFNVTSGNVAFDSLMIADGNDQSSDCFGARSCGSGIYMTSGTAVTLTHTTMISSSADFGGGIFNTDGTLTINNSTISGNLADSDGGGIFNYVGTLTINNSTISGNSATSGGSTYNVGTFTLNNSTISGNSATRGGGIYNVGTLTINNSTISGNSASSDGGGIYTTTFFNKLTINNSTISGNSATSNGGGIYNNFGTITLSTSIIANSTSGGDCMNNSGTVTDNGFNLIEDSANACGLIDDTNDNIIGQYPSLGLLQDNGGSTLTYALLSGSPAIDTGDPAYSAGGYDQRGVGYDRVINGRIDIGAYEMAVYTLTVALNGTGGGLVHSFPSGITCGVDCNQAYHDETAVILTATAPISSTFSGWSGAITTTNNPISLTMDMAKAVTATFTLNTYSLTVAKDGTGDGLVASVPIGIDCGADCSAVYDYETAVILTATAPISSTFSGWSGAITTTNNPISLTMDMAKAVTATFTLNTYSLTVAKDGTGDGLVASAPIGIDCGANCSAVYDYGMVVVLTATAPISSTFTGWSEAIVTTANPISLTMDMAKAVTATFTLNTYPLTVAKDGTGDGLVTSAPIGIDCGMDCSEVYDYETAVILTATAPISSTFMGWAGDCTGAGNCVVTMSETIAVTATFTLDTNVLTVLKDGTGDGAVTSILAGIVCGDDCSELYDYGTAVMLTTTANAGYFAGWSGDCTGTGNCMVTMDAAKNVTATFTLYSTFLPVVMNNYASLPDLVVEDVTITTDSLELIIRNVGNAPLSGSFWVDMYINPNTPPTGINQTWETNGGEGLVWGVENLSLAQGEALTLTMSSPSYFAEFSNFSGTITTGSTVYVQVDSAGLSWFGNVHELDEGNNIIGPLVTTVSSTPSGILSTVSFSDALMEIRP